ncbi:MAG: ribonuclease P protein component [Deltaproteobacteria bacterium]|nr:ribonuclease P protein component [Deltaproteobacteria bacterium]
MRSTRDFARVERQGIRAGSTLVAVTVRPGPGRLGLVVSKKVHNHSAERNRLKRQLREIFRLEKSRWATRAKAVDVVVTVRPEALGSTFAALRDDALKTLEQALQKLSTTKPLSRR